MTKTSLSNNVVILGAGGLIGSALFSYFRNVGEGLVCGTKRTGLGEYFLYLDTTNAQSVAEFPWEKFTTVIDCTGNIDYRNEPVSLQQNFEMNVLGPLRVIDKLHANHHYYYLSSHALLQPRERYNSYLLSKSYFEEIASFMESAPQVTIFRIPGIFDDSRNDGLLYKIKMAYLENKPLNFDFKAEFWHCMYLPRLVEVIAACVGKPHESIVHIGYKSETSLKQILETAERVTGNKIPVSIRVIETDHYKPDTQAQDLYISLSESSFVYDLETYFRT
jgi:nucleoside-diphosphate-sugar epimerase